jgi:hypothetical protein
MKKSGKKLNLPAECFSIHAEEKEYLYVQASQIDGAGKGLYTAIKIYRNEIIAVFKGEELSSDEAARRAKRNENKYFMMLPSGGTLDCMHTAGFAKYANDAEGKVKTGFINNACIVFQGDDICLVAITFISPGKEIFCSYGNRYWKHRHKKNKK